MVVDHRRFQCELGDAAHASCAPSFTRSGSTPIPDPSPLEGEGRLFQPRLEEVQQPAPAVFMTADAACASVVLALVLWFLARDPVRYQPLVRLLSWTFLITGLLWISLGMQCPLPWWWTSSAAGGCMAVGLLLRGGGDVEQAAI